ncbi:hypothetical protein GCM10009665_54700 [Kitasatospora nipponensis]|uniref:Predicted membrane protein YciQ-like C-terminal domain-containing protein n=1 Tax=Kitasatospora nipponensis TaxID=258049 RepID=A0ABN1WS20_9ACTN
MSIALQLVLAGAGATALWLLGYLLAALATRNGTVTAGPATQELGPDPESPAVVSLLAGNWRSVSSAAAATLLDLAAAGLVELRQPGADPAQSTIHLGALTMPPQPYARRVLARVVSKTAGGGGPVGGSAFRGQEQATAWNRGLQREVIAEARRLGLSRPRLGPTLRGALTGAAFVPAVLFGAAVIADGHNVRAACTVGTVAFLPLFLLIALLTSERATARGLERAGHWAGVRAWLAGHEEFAQLPPASVAVWGRYPAYGAALRVSNRTVRLLGFDAGSRRRVWSDFGGTWREVRIRYPRLRPGYGADRGRLLQLAAAAATVAVGLLVFALLRRPDWAAAPGVTDTARRPGLILSAGWVVALLLGVLVANRMTRWWLLAGFLAVMPGNLAPAEGWWRRALDQGGPLPGEAVVLAAFAALAGHYLVLAATHGRRTRTAVGEVLRLESRIGKRSPRLLALDEGATDRTTAWAVPRSLAAAAAPGSRVRLTVADLTRTVLSVEVLSAGTEAARPAPAPRTG